MKSLNQSILKLFFVPRNRDKRLAEHPWTPQKNLKYSRRAFDGLVNVWRKKLHWYDPSNMNFGRFKNENA